MKFFISSALIGLSLSELAYAHAHLIESQPAEGSIVMVAPAKLVLKFSEAARVTALTLQKDGEGEQKLAPLPSVPAQEVTVPTPKLSSGKYAVNWRVISADNHIMSGTLHFTIDTAAKTPPKTLDHSQAH